ncbi:Uma2 family endonuclease [Gloeobacter kilaueensis]|uniref:Putative restriction endonuclease domain-containing protein n=1 Tax=Gloeobacter kilaueensis (strain ATCC BAA-2537 / CCAP 1431/1 / ULC 316 / JS1) TaxID=1183438 RepID=U5QSA5_GLOK1|nr:Uma2 family endonuclease [Gloeobacter kilaueensis]AGY60595.1 hypothetical protein GKIL_4349 [Gloeobacter kilaueensis JS1]
MIASEEPVFYPESDGQPMAENTEQFHWIVYIKEGLEWLFAADPTVFVAGDLLWYPVEGKNKIRLAPDAMVAFGRPKGRRGSYLQWKEGNIPPQVVFEVLSPGNTALEMTRKFQFYQRYGVEEYYVYDPDSGGLDGAIRQGAVLEAIEEMEGWISPRLGVRFERMEQGELRLWRPDGSPFESYTELAGRAEQAEQRAGLAEERAEQAEQRVQQLAEQLRQLGLEPENGEG